MEDATALLCDLLQPLEDSDSEGPSTEIICPSVAKPGVKGKYEKSIEAEEKPRELRFPSWQLDIGPIHYPKYINHGERYREFKRHRQKYVTSFLKRAEMTVWYLAKFIGDFAFKIIDCYNPKVTRIYHDDYGCLERMKAMVAMDVGFIIEVFLRAYFEEPSLEQTNVIIDTPSRLYGIQERMFYIGNQLPFFILKQTYELAFGQQHNYPSFIDLTCHFFKRYYNPETVIRNIGWHEYAAYKAKLEGSKHFTDLLRTLQLSQKQLVDPLKQPQECQYSAVVLFDAGVRFRASTGSWLLDIEFNPENGKLTIPQLKVDDSTNSFFHSLIYWEKSFYQHKTLICDYILLMSSLIRSTDDLKLLLRKRIIINQLGRHEQVLELFSRLCQDIIPSEKSHYSGLLGELNDYNVRHLGWIAILRIRYFHNRWRTFATFGGISFLLLTLFQTIFSGVNR